MSTRRLLEIPWLPIPVTKAFRNAGKPISSQEELWRARAARLTLDALGYTSLTAKPDLHNTAVRYARAWFRGWFDNPQVDWVEIDNVMATFDLGGVMFDPVQKAVLATPARLMEFVEIYDNEGPLLENDEDSATTPGGDAPR